MSCRRVALVGCLVTFLALCGLQALDWPTSSATALAGPTTRAEGREAGEVAGGRPQPERPIFQPRFRASRPPVLKMVYLPVLMRNFPRTNVIGVDMGALTEARGLDTVLEAGTTWVRRDAVLWADVEPTEGERSWNKLAGLEQELRRAAERRLEVILIVRKTPEWAQATPGVACGAIAADKLRAFGEFMHDLVRRYSGPPYNVTYWEIWNEPDAGRDMVPVHYPFGCWGEPENEHYGGGYYGEMLKVVYPRMKEAAPHVQVLVGGLLLDCDPRGAGTCQHPWSSRFLEGILRGGGGPFFDGVSFHAYDYYHRGANVEGRYGNSGWASRWDTTGPVMITKARFIRETLERYGAQDKFLINTEAALLCSKAAEPQGGAGCEAAPHSNFERTKANYVAQVYAATIAEGIRASVWYSLYGWRDSALLNRAQSPRPAFAAYRFAAHELAGARFKRALTEYPGVTGYVFERGGRVVWLVWSRDGVARTLGLPRRPLAVYDVVGEAQPAGEVLTVDVGPLYVEWAAE